MQTAKQGRTKTGRTNKFLATFLTLILTISFINAAAYAETCQEFCNSYESELPGMQGFCLGRSQGSNTVIEEVCHYFDGTGTSFENDDRLESFTIGECLTQTRICYCFNKHETCSADQECTTRGCQDTGTGPITGAPAGTPDAECEEHCGTEYTAELRSVDINSGQKYEYVGGDCHFNMHSTLRVAGDKKYCICYKSEACDSEDQCRKDGCEDACPEYCRNGYEGKQYMLVGTTRRTGLAFACIEDGGCKTQTLAEPTEVAAGNMVECTAGWGEAPCEQVSPPEEEEERTDFIDTCDEACAKTIFHPELTREPTYNGGQCIENTNEMKRKMQNEFPANPAYCHTRPESTVCVTDAKIHASITGFSDLCPSGEICLCYNMDGCEPCSIDGTEPTCSTSGCTADAKKEIVPPEEEEEEGATGNVYDFIRQLKEAIEELACSLFCIVLYIAAGVAVLFILFSGVKFMTSGDDEAARNDAKQHIIYVLVGLIVIAVAYPLIQYLFADTAIGFYECECKDFIIGEGGDGFGRHPSEKEKDIGTDVECDDSGVCEAELGKYFYCSSYGRTVGKCFGKREKDEDCDADWEINSLNIVCQPPYICTGGKCQRDISTGCANHRECKTNEYCRKDPASGLKYCSTKKGSGARCSAEESIDGNPDKVCNSNWCVGGECAGINDCETTNDCVRHYADDRFCSIKSSEYKCVIKLGVDGECRNSWIVEGDANEMCQSKVCSANKCTAP